MSDNSTVTSSWRRLTSRASGEMIRRSCCIFYLSFDDFETTFSPGSSELQLVKLTYYVINNYDKAQHYQYYV